MKYLVKIRKDLYKLWEKFLCLKKIVTGNTECCEDNKTDISNLNTTLQQLSGTVSNTPVYNLVQTPGVNDGYTLMATQPSSGVSTAMGSFTFPDNPDNSYNPNYTISVVDGSAVITIEGKDYCLAECNDCIEGLPDQIIFFENNWNLWYNNYELLFAVNYLNYTENFSDGSWLPTTDQTVNPITETITFEDGQVVSNILNFTGSYYNETDTNMQIQTPFFLSGNAPNVLGDYYSNTNKIVEYNIKGNIELRGGCGAWYTDTTINFQETDFTNFTDPNGNGIQIIYTGGRVELIFNKVT